MCNEFEGVGGRLLADSQEVHRWRPGLGCQSLSMPASAPTRRARAVVAAAVAAALALVGPWGRAIATAAPDAAGYWMLEANGDVLPFGLGDVLPVTGSWLPLSVSCLAST